ncbi:MAG: formylglycine-generating enzyme family protein [Gemmataceae bacterium]|nr:formylglycine-generating enzyme family protein [Gemmataceae bacterium]
MNRHLLRVAALAALPAAFLLLPASADGQDKEKPAAEITNSIGMKLRRIPAGSVNVRITAEDWLIAPVESYDIEVKQPIHLGAFEVTQAEYEAVMGKNPSAFAPRGDNRARVKGLDTKRFPAENITWAEANEFCAKLSAMEKEKEAKRTYRLPTSDEWEYCARAGSSVKVLFAFGDSLSSSDANFNGQVPYGEKAAKGKDLKRPTEVGSYKPNAWGLHDMHGNVWEWTSDPYRTKEGKPDGDRKLLRGGSWINRARDCAASTRLVLAADQRYNNIGFRVVCEVGK